jgi:ABC-type Na+ efflux pump permease subunit
VKALVMAGSALRRLARDRLALFFIVLLPVVIILIIGVTFGDAASQRLPVGVVDQGAGRLGNELRAGLEASPALDARAYADVDGLRKAVRRGVVSAGVVLPAGYDRALRAGDQAQVTFVVDQTRPAPFPVRSAVAAVVARQAAQVKAARFAAEQEAVPFDAALDRARAVAAGQAAVRVEATTIGGRADALPTGFNYTAPANLVLTRLGLLLSRDRDLTIDVGELDPAAGGDDLDEVEGPVVLVELAALDDLHRRAGWQVEPLLLGRGRHADGEDVGGVGGTERLPQPLG